MTSDNKMEIFKNKKVIVTGHTGFKGSWLTAWLKILGADVIGISLDPPTPVSHYDSANIADGIEDYRTDIRNLDSLVKIFADAKPDYVFHLAAQPIVAKSYNDPIETWTTNVLGTINILEALKNLSNQCTAVIITSDKCYDNVEWEWGYRENDALGGPDPYSASKGAAEIAIKSYVKSYFNNPKKGIRVASARAGNVIGGGDWADNRIVPDSVKAWSNDQPLELRNPHSTRPWQHVLEPLGGYLVLASKLSSNDELHGEAFNFGPPSQQNYSVLSLVEEMSKHWEKVNWEVPKKSNDSFYESGLLKLNCDKALHLLDWKAVLKFEDTVKLTAEWYRSFYEDEKNISETTDKQINIYQKLLS
tara:strand:- start:752 stop:1834 length:1083 start_codon:yes stop_codon:yes gene_type:complete